MIRVGDLQATGRMTSGMAGARASLPQTESSSGGSGRMMGGCRHLQSRPSAKQRGRDSTGVLLARLLPSKLRCVSLTASPSPASRSYHDEQQKVIEEQGRPWHVSINMEAG